MRLLILLALFSFGCENNLGKKESCSIQGFSRLKSKNISCSEPLILRDVEFSNGSTYKLIQGTISLNKQKYIFSILSDATEVIKHNFPLTGIDSSAYLCSLKFLQSKRIEIEWRNGVKRLYLKKSLPK